MTDSAHTGLRARARRTFAGAGAEFRAGIRAEWAEFRAGIRAEWRIFRQPPSPIGPVLDAALLAQAESADRLGSLCHRLGLIDTDRGGS